MSNRVVRIIGRRRGSAAFACLMATVVAGCSADSMRLDSPLFMTDGSDQTGSINPVPLASVGASGAPSGQIASAPVAPVQHGSFVGNGVQPAWQGQQQTGQPYQPPRIATPQTGTIVIQQGDTLYSVAQRAGTTVPDLMHANGLNDPTNIRVGQSLRLPASSSGQAAGGPVRLASAPAAPIAAPAAVPAQNATRPMGGFHTVEAGETVYSIARRYGVAPNTIIAGNELGANPQLRIGQRLAIPEPGQGAVPSQTVATTPVQPAVQTTTTQQVTTAPVPAPGQVETSTPSPQPQQVSLGQQTVPEPKAMQSTSFRWPVRGRIISGFGEQTDAGVNDGIKIAVPAGTSIRAAENGVVIYAGNELQGFGNLILVRHAEGWVTAYAHNEEMLVSRGDEVQRGQIISRAGSTGEVSTPQLHFEVRRGSQPVDPLQYLSAL